MFHGHGGLDPNRWQEHMNKAEGMNTEAKLRGKARYHLPGRRSIAYKLAFPIAFLIVFGILIALAVMYG
ncbi:MAG: hypothetical protein L0177_01840 [Chloroflexi bacterium]|nr:hypothetical protein [Chloroflexota bacterium]